MSYTTTTPVALTLSCPPCKATIGSDNTNREWVELFRTAHTHGERPPFFVCYPCAEGAHEGCSRYPCECRCREKKEQK